LKFILLIIGGRLRGKINRKLVDVMKNLKNKGLSYNEISKILGVSAFTVYYYLNKDFREKHKEVLREKYRNDEKYKSKILISSTEQRLRAEELAKKYPEYADVVDRYIADLKQKGSSFKHSYKIFKEKVLKLRKKYNVNFPLNIGAPWNW
jgi:transposase